MTTRIQLQDLQGVSAHLVPTAAAAFAAGFDVSLWMVRDLTVVHVRDGYDEWCIFEPERMDFDAMAVFTRIPDASLSMNGVRVVVAFNNDIRSRYVGNVKLFRGDKSAAYRAAIVCAAHKLYKVTQNESIDCNA